MAVQTCEVCLSCTCPAFFATTKLRRGVGSRKWAGVSIICIIHLRWLLLASFFIHFLLSRELLSNMHGNGAFCFYLLNSGDPIANM
jgi:hypothetical protein